MPKLSATLEKALNDQFNREMHSSQIYLAMAAHLETRNLPKLANWLKLQSDEEREHAMKYYEFINKRDGKASIDALEAPPATWDSPLALFEAALAHEEKVTNWTNDLVELSLKEKDHATHNFLQFFVAEQVEEESQVRNIVDQLRMVNNMPALILHLEKTLGKRKK
eukprot:TRINITY_DN923_c0_g1_i1.p1 TRINITY_DN923_c0_g1~~TRINITY_DN923_c0_g1_i1.p1  ORF type:complete len:185 (-),score=89.72 TRINITY_DN923_c0_g1_i1:86-583(-)